MNERLGSHKVIYKRGFVRDRYGFYLHLYFAEQGLNFFLLIFQISTVQWLKCRNLKDDLNCSYNGGGYAYLHYGVSILINLTV